MSNYLYYLLYYLIFLITIYLSIFLIRYAMNIKTEFNNKAFSLLILLSIICFILDVYNITLIKNIAIYGAYLIYIRLINKESYKTILKGILFILVIGIISELISGLIFGLILHISTDNRYLYLLVRTICYIEYFFMSLYTIAIIKKLKINRDYLSFTVKSLLFVITLFLIIGTINYLSTYNKDIMIYFLFITLLLFIITGFIIIIRLIKKNYERNLEISYLKSKNNEVSKYLNEFKSYKHNLRYDLIYIKQVGNKKVNKMVDKLIDSNDCDLKYINNFNEIPSSLIHIFTDRLSINNNNDITILINNSYPDKEIVIDDQDYLIIYEIIGNCLTNAIEALPDKNGVIIINFYEEDKQQYIEIINNFRNDIDIEKLGTISYSTKNRDSGFGLNSILNSNIKVNVSIKNDLFIVNILIP